MLDSAVTVNEIGADTQLPAVSKIAINEKAATALAEVADWLERGGKHKGVVGFDMCGWVQHDANPCGTVCCIGGALAEFNDLCGSAEVIDVLNIPGPDALRLFIPSRYKCGVDWEYDKISPAHAARTIRHYIATGVVDWQACRG